MTRFGMVIDLKKCIGCHACTIACKAENSTKPGIFWNRVYDQEFGKYPLVRRRFLPVLCMHCENAPCIEVCPTGASYKRDDGIVLIDQDKCVGCKYCILACPYGARYYNNGKEGYFGTEFTAEENIGYPSHKLGIVEKCTFCLHRIEQGKEPACVQTCPPKARYFGNLDDPNSHISQLIRSKQGFQLFRGLDTNPCVYYLPP
jgi:Fe-S-cluster-containing dehydrogenase component